MLRILKRKRLCSIPKKTHVFGKGYTEMIIHSIEILVNPTPTRPFPTTKDNKLIKGNWQMWVWVKLPHDCTFNPFLPIHQMLNCLLLQYFAFTVGAHVLYAREYLKPKNRKPSIATLQCYTSILSILIWFLEFGIKTEKPIWKFHHLLLFTLLQFILSESQT